MNQTLVSRPNMRIWLVAAVLTALCCFVNAANAQDRLVGLRALSGGAVFEQVRFGGEGLLQAGVAGADSARITGATQITFPISAAMPLGRNFTLDITTIYSAGEIRFAPAAGGAERTASLTGLSDVRVRTSGRFFDDALIFTFGLNAPTGRTELDSSEVAALRVLAAPALALGAVPLGSGLSGTVGMLTAQQAGPWAIAAGIAYEYRGTYQPVAALTSGAPSADFQPGGVIRLSFGADRLLGKHRLTLTAAGDLFQADELRGATASSAPLAKVQLGPIYSVDAQLQLGVPRLRELTLWSAVRYRSNFSRDDVTVDSSNGIYYDGGIRSTIPLSPRTDFIVALDGRYHSGLAIDAGLPTSGVTSTSATLGFSQRLGALALQPFVRASVGRVQARGAQRDAQQADLTGFAGGLVIISRF
jgi:hypothetical protein